MAVLTLGTLRVREEVLDWIDNERAQYPMTRHQFVTMILEQQYAAEKEQGGGNADYMSEPFAVRQDVG